MPRVFGVNMENTEVDKEDTAFYGVDVDHQGTVIAAGTTYSMFLVTDSLGT
jgi:hypothetical protein